MGKRSRKRVGPEGRRAAVATAQGAAGKPARAPRTRTGQRIATRPKPLWDPFPLTEIALGLGLVLVVIGFIKGPSGGSLIGVGVLMATAGVVELCAREHFSGFKSHTLLLAFLPVVALHTILRLWVTDSWEGPVPLLIDFAVFGILAMVFLDRYRRARPGSTRP